MEGSGYKYKHPALRSHLLNTLGPLSTKQRKRKNIAKSKKKTKKIQGSSRKFRKRIQKKKERTEKKIRRKIESVTRSLIFSQDN